MKPALIFPRARRAQLTHIYFCAALFFAIGTIRADDPFADVIRKTDALTPEQEQKSFHLPPGFEIQLVASEPQIGKPMNMAFDAKGRMWITQSREYPFPVLPVEKPGRDKVMILENFDVNGRAQKFSQFVDGLNICIGLYPYKNGVVAFSIPKIHYFSDNDGDGKSDKDEILLSGFGYEKDTHGLTSNFKRGFDGWIYADHGFNNDSTVVARDGSTIKMNSGNCYRFKPDGSHVEQHSWGQVNPFGLMFDPLGDLWSADCHSSPTYILLHGAYYPSFGKPNDGLGFAPVVCEHSHGSTAICGMVFYAAENFPPEFRGNTFIGNVMTCRINRDSYPESGSTRLAKEEPDFLSSDDPWFRPVNMELGPDGAIYVADFYNKIIGHYEVPLTHPGRDRERGRIWRIVYTGKNVSREGSEGKKVSSQTSHDVSAQLKLPTNVKGLIAELGNSNITRRMLAMNWLVDEIGKPAIKPIQKMMRDKKTNAFQKAHGLWILHRLGALDEKILANAAKDSDRLVRVHTMRVLAETEKWSPKQNALALAGLQDADAFTQRAAADAIGRHAAFENVQPLLKLRHAVPGGDGELLYGVRISLRNQLLPLENFMRVQNAELSEADSRAIADVAVGVKTEGAGIFLLKHMQKFSESNDKLATYLRHASRYIPVEQMDALAKFTQQKFADDIDFQLTLFKSVQEGLAQRGAKLSAGVSEWGAELAEKMFASVDEKSLDWRNSPLKEKNADATNPWFLETRDSADGKKAQFICSLSPGGEKLTGVLRSKTFTIPEKLNFFLAGHDGSPDRKLGKKNFVRLRDFESEKILKQVQPPRNDVAQPVSWDLKEYAGKRGFLEIIDGNSGHSYAWLAAGRFDPELVPLPKIIPNQVDRRQQSAAELAGSLHLAKLEAPLSELLLNQNANVDARSAAAKSLVTLNAGAHISDLEKIISNAEEPDKLREQSAQSLAGINSENARTILVQALATAPQNLQTQIGLALASSAEGADALLEAVANGKASARLLQERTIKDRLTASKPANLAARLEKLTKNLPKADAERQKLIDARFAAFNSAEASANLGAQIFQKNCMPCHSLDGRGATVGPQLDGVGNRGAARIIEDILDPSRNVDRAFRTTLFTMKDGDVQSGLFRRDEGEMTVLADATGKEFSIAKKEIAERRESELSLMPDNFSQIISPEEFNQLIAFLVSKGTKSPAKK